MATIRSDDKIEEKLDFFSPHFDPLKALYTKGLVPPVPNIKVFNNLAEYAFAIKEGKAKSSGSEESSITSKRQSRASRQPASRTRNLRPEFKATQKDVLQDRLLGLSERQALSTVESRKTSNGRMDPSKLQELLLTEEAIKERGRKKKRPMNVLEKMEGYSEGPFSILHTCLTERKKVKVWTRRYKGLRSVLTGYLVAFDKHLNLALFDVDEVYTLEERVERRETGNECLYGKKKKKKKNRDRKTPSGENIELDAHEPELQTLCEGTNVPNIESSCRSETVLMERESEVTQSAFENRSVVPFQDNDTLTTPADNEWASQRCAFTEHYDIAQKQTDREISHDILAVESLPVLPKVLSIDATCTNEARFRLASEECLDIAKDGVTIATALTVSSKNEPGSVSVSLRIAEFKDDTDKEALVPSANTLSKALQPTYTSCGRQEQSYGDSGVLIGNERQQAGKGTVSGTGNEPENSGCKKSESPNEGSIAKLKDGHSFSDLGNDLSTSAPTSGSTEAHVVSTDAEPGGKCTVLPSSEEKLASGDHKDKDTIETVANGQKGNSKTKGSSSCLFMGTQYVSVGDDDYQGVDFSLLHDEKQQQLKVRSSGERTALSSAENERQNEHHETITVLIARTEDSELTSNENVDSKQKVKVDEPLITGVDDRGQTFHVSADSETRGRDAGLEDKPLIPEALSNTSYPLKSHFNVTNAEGVERGAEQYFCKVIAQSEAERANTERATLKPQTIGINETLPVGGYILHRELETKESLGQCDQAESFDDGGGNQGWPLLDDLPPPRTSSSEISSYVSEIQAVPTVPESTTERDLLSSRGANDNGSCSNSVSGKKSHESLGGTGSVFTNENDDSSYQVLTDSSEARSEFGDCPSSTSADSTLYLSSETQSLSKGSSGQEEPVLDKIQDCQTEGSVVRSKLSGRPEVAELDGCFLHCGNGKHERHIFNDHVPKLNTEMSSGGRTVAKNLEDSESQLKCCIVLGSNSDRSAGLPEAELKRDGEALKEDGGASLDCNLTNLGETDVLGVQSVLDCLEQVTKPPEADSFPESMVKSMPSCHSVQELKSRLLNDNVKSNDPPSKEMQLPSLTERLRNKSRIASSDNEKEEGEVTSSEDESPELQTPKQKKEREEGELSSSESEIETSKEGVTSDQPRKTAKGTSLKTRRTLRTSDNSDNVRRSSASSQGKTDLRVKITEAKRRWPPSSRRKSVSGGAASNDHSVRTLRTTERKDKGEGISRRTSPSTGKTPVASDGLPRAVPNQESGRTSKKSKLSHTSSVEKKGHRMQSLSSSTLCSKKQSRDERSTRGGKHENVEQVSQEGAGKNVISKPSSAGNRKVKKDAIQPRNDAVNDKARFQAYQDDTAQKKKAVTFPSCHKEEHKPARSPHTRPSIKGTEVKRESESPLRSGVRTKGTTSRRHDRRIALERTKTIIAVERSADKGIHSTRETPKESMPLDTRKMKDETLEFDFNSYGENKRESQVSGSLRVSSEKRGRGQLGVEKAATKEKTDFDVKREDKVARVRSDEKAKKKTSRSDGLKDTTTKKTVEQCSHLNNKAKEIATNVKPHSRTSTNSGNVDRQPLSSNQKTTSFQREKLRMNDHSVSIANVKTLGTEKEHLEANSKIQEKEERGQCSSSKSQTKKCVTLTKSDVKGKTKKVVHNTSRDRLPNRQGHIHCSIKKEKAKVSAFRENVADRKTSSMTAELHRKRPRPIDKTEVKPNKRIRLQEAARDSKQSAKEASEKGKENCSSCSTGKNTEVGKRFASKPYFEQKITVKEKTPLSDNRDKVTLVDSGANKEESSQSKRLFIGRGKCLVFKRRHVSQLFIRGDNVVLVAYAK